MQQLLTDLHLAIFLAVCIAASFVVVIARACIREFVRKHESEVSSRFDFATRPPFLSWKSGPDEDPGEAQMFRWLKAGGAREVMQRHSNFAPLWRWYRSSEVATVALVSLWLPLIVWHIAQRISG
jgi:hypothetical protein